MKKMVFVLLVILCITIPVKAENISDNAQEVCISSVPLNQLQQKAVSGKASEIFPDIDINELVSGMLKGKGGDYKSFFNTIIIFFFKEFLICLKLGLILLALALITSLLSNLQKELGKGEVSQLGFMCCYLVFAGFLVRSFTIMVSSGAEAIENMTLFMQALIPVLIGLLASGGSIISAGALHGWLMMSLQVIAIVASRILVPMIYFIATLSIVDHISESIRITGFIKLLKLMVKWGQGILMTVFTGIFVSQGIIGASLDSVAAKTAKFAVGNFIPVVGGMISESLEVLKGTSRLIRNSVGLAGIFVIIAIAVVPLVKTVANMWILRLTAAAMEPAADKKMVSAVNSIADCMSCIFSSVCIFAVLFIASVGIILSVGGFSSGG